MNFSEKILRLRKDKGLSQQEAARELGVSLHTLLRWEKGVREPRLDEIRKLADLFGCTPADLVSNANLPSTASLIDLPPQTAVPVFDVSVGCGPDGWQPEDAHAVAVEYFDEDKVRMGSYALKTVGNSLEGDGIMEGDIVLVNPYQGEDIKPEWIMYVIYDGVPMLKHVIYHRSGAIELRGANPKESPRLIPPEMTTDYFTICGRIVSLKRNF